MTDNQKGQAILESLFCLALGFTVLLLAIGIGLLGLGRLTSRFYLQQAQLCVLKSQPISICKVQLEVSLASLQFLSAPIKKINGDQQVAFAQGEFCLHPSLDRLFPQSTCWQENLSLSHKTLRTIPEDKKWYHFL